MSREALYTLLYPFMSEILGLYGYEKETFAVIFNFWMNAGERSVRAPLSVIQRITGGTRPTIVKAISSLITANFIKAEKRPGKPTLYLVTISQEVLEHFKATYIRKPVKPFNQKELNALTSTSSDNKPRNKTNDKNKTDTTLRTLKKDEITTGGLPEAK